MSLEDVAKRAKVSTATVSRVLNGVAGVRNATRDRVLRAAQELKYHPNLHARTLAGGRSSTLGMIVSNLENPFFMDIFKAAESDARGRGYEIILANTNYNPEILVKNIRQMIGWRVSGLALVVSEMDQHLNELLDVNIPVTCYDVSESRKNITNIAVNYAGGMEQLVNYLHGLGHRRMAFVGHHSSLSPLRARQEAFREKVEALAPAVKWQIASNSDTIVGGRLAAREILDSVLEPTAIICVNDFMALGVLHELRLAGIRVPEDISVTGFDDISLAGISHPALTTLSVPREKIGRLMMQSLIAPSELQSNRFLIQPEFVIRGTTAGARTTAFQTPVSAMA